jgi:hypothetical protein
MTLERNDGFKLKTPVLLIAFNRPDTTKVVFERIRELQPEKLYVAIDGPRESYPGEELLCSEVEYITKNVDWPCEPKYLIRKQNLGCKLGVSTAISWVLSNEDSVIIIEDDILASKAFFQYTQELLEKYKNHTSIAMVSGNNYTPLHDMESDYLFSKYGHIWGWATWKRAWQNYDVNLSSLKYEDIDKIVDNNFDRKKEKVRFKKRFKNLLERVEKKTINTWDSQYFIYRMQMNYLSIVPKYNLCTNIGQDYSSRTGKHADKDGAHVTSKYPSQESFKIKTHPESIACDLNYDHIHFDRHINKKKPLFKRVLGKMTRVLKSFTRDNKD